MKTFIKGQEYFLEISIIDSDGEFVSGLIIGYDVRNSDTNVSIQSGNLTEEGNIYKTSITISDSGQYRVFYETPNGYENGQDSIIVEEAIEDRVWDENLTSHLGGDKAGQHLEDADAIADLTNVAQAVWDYISETGTDSMQEILLKIKGLTQSNYRIFSPVYTKIKEVTVMTSAQIKIYANSSDCNNDNNAIGVFSVVATYDADGNMQTYKVLEA